MVINMIHEMVNIEGTEAELQKKYKQVGNHLYIKTDELNVKPLTDEEKKNLQIVFMMGGGGARLLHVTKGEISKHMIDIAGRPISKFTIDLWKGVGCSDFCFLIDNTKMGMSIQNFYGSGADGINNLYSIEQTKLGSGGAIKQAIETGMIKGPFISHFPDDLIVNYPNFAEDFVKVFVAAMKAGYQVVVVCVPGMLYPFGEVVDEGGKVIDFVEKPFISKDSNTGVYGIGMETFDIIKKLDTSGGPVKIERSVFKILAQQGKMLKVLLPSEYWIPVNDEPNLKKFVSLVNGWK